MFKFLFNNGVTFQDFFFYCPYNPVRALLNSRDNAQDLGTFKWVNIELKRPYEGSNRPKYGLKMF